MNVDIHGRPTLLEDGSPMYTTLDRRQLPAEFSEVPDYTFALQPKLGFSGHVNLIPFTDNIPTEDAAFDSLNFLASISTATDSSSVDDTLHQCTSQSLFEVSATPVESSLSTAPLLTTKEWSHNRVLLLIETFAKFKNRLSDSKYKKKDVWSSIADTVSDSSNMKITADECDKKWRNLVATYKRIVDNGHKTGRGGKSWVYFDRVHEVVGKSPANVSLNKFVVPKKKSAPTVGLVNEDLIEPSSETETEDVIVEKSAVDLAGQKTNKQTKRSQPPEWFIQFEKRMRDDRLDREQKMKEQIRKQEEYQNERLKVMKETNELLKTLLMGRPQEE